LAKQLRENKHVTDVRLWTAPYESILAAKNPNAQGELQKNLQPYQFQPVLMRGRLFQFKGSYEGEANQDGEKSATRFYQMVRVPEDAMEEVLGQIVEQQLLADPRFQQMRASGQLPQEQIDQLKEKAIEDGSKQWRVAKQHATYWLGLIAFERGHYPTAVDYLQRKTLEVSEDGPWTNGAHYNLARAFEAQGKFAEAIEHYRADQSPQRHGSQLRASWLEKSPEQAASR
jgi:tetratricopeptide (TPR) repeat protein